MRHPGRPLPNRPAASKDVDLLNRHLQPRLATAWRAPIYGRVGAGVLRWPWHCLRALLVALAASGGARADVAMPELNPGAPVAVTAEAGNHWTEGSYEVWLLRGNCRIRQGDSEARGREAVVWVGRADADPTVLRKVTVYLEGDVAVEIPRAGSTTRISDTQWLGRFTTQRGVEVRAGVVAGEPKPMPPIYERAMAERDPQSSAIRPAQYAAPLMAGPTAPVPPPGTRRIRAVPRGDVIPDAQWFPDPTGTQWIAVIDSGVTLIVEGLRTKNVRLIPGGDVGSIDVSADRLVIWTAGPREPDLTGQTAQSEDMPLEIYLEGNIVFRQGTRVIYADRMYYDVRRQVGTVVHAEMLTPVPKFEGLVRLRTELLQQTGPGVFVAENSYFTSSRLGEPGYRVQAGDVTFEDFQQPVLDPATGQQVVDPITGEPQVIHERLVTGRNGLLFFEGIPVFYWPVFSTNLEEASFYLRRIRYNQDNVFGTQLLSDWDMFQLLGIRKKPHGTDWTVSGDYLSKRGFGHGTTFTYDRPDFFGFATPTAGLIEYWGIQDRGLDQLPGRPPLPPDPDVAYRYRLLMQHRQCLPDDFELRAEVGLISDRNFLEEYFLHEWNELKDETTGVELKQRRGNSSWSITADARVNDFFTQTESLPRLDHFWLGEPLLNDSFTWYEHSTASYSQLQIAQPPTNPASDPFLLLPWEHQASGERLISRQELDWPFQAGPVKVVPYALGEVGHWGEGIDGQPVDRLYGQVGLRASMPAWRVYSDVESNLWNVHGIAHKIVFDAEVSFADANRNLGDLPLYDPLDDDSLEAYRNRYAYQNYKSPFYPLDRYAVIPQRFDERYYAIRAGMGSWVTAQSMEIADDLAAVRMGVRQRWQTKRGMPGQRKIIDWITLDTNLTFFPDPSRDNFGSSVGLLDYDFRWHVGDRLTVVSDGMFDFFDGGLSEFNAGVFLSHPPRGNLYLGFNFVDGPLFPTSRVFSASYSYWMSPKWISSAGISINLNGSSIGHNVSITRVGESFLISAGFTLDAIRNNTGIMFAVEPRFMPRGKLGSAGGGRVPIAGAYGLE